MTLKEKYKTADPVGIYVINNFGGLVILDIDGEKATAAYHFGEKYESIRRHTIYYTFTGRAYIRKNGRRYYFDQIMKTNGGY